MCQNEKFQDTRVKNLFIFTLAPGLQENYYNISESGKCITWY